MSKQSPKQPKNEAEKQNPRKTYRFRIYPTRKQTQTLKEWLGLCCEVYNAALDERRSAYRMAGVSLSYAHQCADKQYGNSFQVLDQEQKKRGALVLAKLGHVKMVVHRAIKGTPKTAVVKRTPTGKWFVAISSEMEEEGVQKKQTLQSPPCRSP